MNRTKFFVRALILSAGLSATASAQTVYVVDEQPGPGVDFTSIAAAVAGVGSGSTILVRAGEYGGDVSITAKLLAIAADPEGAAVRLLGRLRVRQLSSNQFVSVAGLHVDASLVGSGLEAVDLDDNLGHVWLEDCRLDGADAAAAFEASGPGLAAFSSAHVTLVRCEVFGGDGSPYDGNPFTGTGAFGLQSISSGTRLFDTHVVGGSNTCSAGAGCLSTSANGMVVLGGTSLLEGSQLEAGDGGKSCPGGVPPCTPGGLGSGLSMYGGSPAVTVFDTSFPVGDPPIEVLSGSLTTLPGDSRDFTITSPVRTGELHTLEFTGVSGDQAWVFAGAAAGDVLAPNLKGALLVSQPSLLLLLGVVPESGVLSLTSQAAGFPAALDSLQVVVQAAFVSGGAAILSDPSRLLLLNPAF